MGYKRPRCKSMIKPSRLVNVKSRAVASRLGLFISPAGGPECSAYVDLVTSLRSWCIKIRVVITNTSRRFNNLNGGKFAPEKLKVLGADRAKTNRLCPEN